MKPSDSNLNIMTMHADFQPPRFFVDVECSDPYWEGDKRRIEVHRDVAYYIFKLREVVADLQEQLRIPEQDRITFP